MPRPEISYSTKKKLFNSLGIWQSGDISLYKIAKAARCDPHTAKKYLLIYQGDIQATEKEINVQIHKMDENGGVIPLWSEKIRNLLRPRS